MQHSIVNISDNVVLNARGPKNSIDSTQAYGCFNDPEYTRNGRIESHTIILTSNKECPFKCVMCDLWKNTTDTAVKQGTITKQIKDALDSVTWAPHIKIYNAGSFFDRKSIPKQDTIDIANLLQDRETLIVEAHPRLVGRSTYEYASLLKPKLEVAMGLETVDPNVLPILNKKMTLHDFEQATHNLIEHEISVRAFILLRTPWQSEKEGVHWAKKSIDFAQSIGVECCIIIPTRRGNGLIDKLEEQGDFSPPSLHSLEEVLSYGIRKKQGRIFADLWDINQFGSDEKCISRIKEINNTQGFSCAL